MMNPVLDEKYNELYLDELYFDEDGNRRRDHDDYI